MLLDAGQVEDNTFIHSKIVIQELFGTFRPADRINVVTFDSTRATLVQPTSVNSPPFASSWHMSFAAE